MALLRPCYRDLVLQPHGPGPEASCGCSSVRGRTALRSLEKIRRALRAVRPCARARSAAGKVEGSLLTSELRAAVRRNAARMCFSRHPSSAEGSARTKVRGETGLNRRVRQSNDDRGRRNRRCIPTTGMARDHAGLSVTTARDFGTYGESASDKSVSIRRVVKRQLALRAPRKPAWRGREAGFCVAVEGARAPKARASFRPLRRR